jgi:chemotaxis protein MotB
MVFFVLLFSMSSIDTKRMKHFKSALQAGLGVLEAGKKTTVAIVDANRPNTAVEDTTADEAQMAETSADPIAAVIESSIKSMQADNHIHATYSHEGITITLKDRVVFSSGSDRLHPGSYPILEQIAQIIHQIRNPVRVEGHTDNLPIQTPRYPSNWELSTARSVTVVKYLIDRQGIAPDRLSAVGYGDSRPVQPNDSPRHRAENRRVDIVILTENGGHHVN